MKPKTKEQTVTARSFIGSDHPFDPNQRCLNTKIQEALSDHMSEGYSELVDIEYKVTKPGTVVLYTARIVTRMEE